MLHRTCSTSSTLSKRIFQYLWNIGKSSLLSFAQQNDDSGSYDVFSIVVVHYILMGYDEFHAKYNN